MIKMNEKNQGKIIFNGTDYHNGSNADTLDSLLDKDINKKLFCGVLVSDNEKSHFKFSLEQDSNIYAYGQHYSDSAGSTPNPIKLYKKISNDKYDLIGEFKTYENEWYLLFPKLKKGDYQIKSTSGKYIQFTEWFVENIKNQKYLIKSDSKYYTTKTKDPLDINNLTKEHFLTYGFSDLNEISAEQNFMQLQVKKEEIDDGSLFEYSITENFKNIFIE